MKFPVNAYRIANRYINYAIVGIFIFMTMSVSTGFAQDSVSVVGDQLRKTEKTEILQQLNSAQCDVSLAMSQLIREGKWGGNLSEAQKRYENSANVLRQLSDDKVYATPLNLTTTVLVSIQSVVGRKIKINTLGDYLAVMATLSEDASRITKLVIDGKAGPNDLARLAQATSAISYLTALAFDRIA